MRTPDKAKCSMDCGFVVTIVDITCVTGKNEWLQRQLTRWILPHVFPQVYVKKPRTKKHNNYIKHMMPAQEISKYNDHSE